MNNTQISGDIPAPDLLKINHLKVTFSTSRGEVYAVNDVVLNVKKGEILGIVGESGSGKSQTMLSLMGLLPKHAHCSGEVLFSDQNLLSLPRAELNKIRGKDIAMIFQDPMTSLNPYLTIKTQLREVLVQHRIGCNSEHNQRMLDALNMVGISDAEKRLNSYPHQMSGGMRQRVMIAMALLGNPKLLIADEPTTALDVTTQAQILMLLKKLQQQLDLTIIIVTHDLSTVSQLCDRVVIFYGGKVVENTGYKELFCRPLHPYTQALIKTIPSVNTPKEQPLASIPGYPQPWLNPPKLCVFKDRCPKKFSTCEKIMPKLLPAEVEEIQKISNPRPNSSLQNISDEKLNYQAHSTHTYHLVSCHLVNPPLIKHNTHELADKYTQTKPSN